MTLEEWRKLRFDKMTDKVMEILKTPKFNFEIPNSSQFSTQYRKLRQIGCPIQRTRISGRCYSHTQSKKTVMGSLFIYYRLSDRKLAFKRVQEYLYPKGRIKTTMYKNLGTAILDGQYRCGDYRRYKKKRF